VGHRRGGRAVVGRQPLSPERESDEAVRRPHLKISAEDIDLTLHEGFVYVADTDMGTTAMVLIGEGTVNFHPAPDTEKGQVKIFCGAESLETKFGSAFLRVNPATCPRSSSRRS